MAELAAWDFLKSEEGKKSGLELVTICPTFIMGPSPGATGEGTSEKYVIGILNGSQSKVPRSRGGFVDVRDCAIAHLYGITKPVANERFLLYKENCYHPDVYSILARFNGKGAKVPTQLVDGPDGIQEDFVDNSKSQRLLGLQYHSIESTFSDMAQSLLDRGLVK